LTSDKFFSEPTTNKNWSQCSEIWIFDATNLEQGPLYKLSHPKMNFGFTVHTTWLKEAVSPKKMNYDIKDDYQDLVQKLMEKESPAIAKKVHKLFEEEIYPHFS